MFSDAASVVNRFAHAVNMCVTTEESLLEWITSDATPESVFAVIKRPPVVPLESETTQLLRVDPDGLRLIEYRSDEKSQAKSEISETRLSVLTDTALVLDHHIDSNTGRIVEASAMRVVGLAQGSLFALRGSVDLMSYTPDERQALVDALANLMPSPAL